MDWNQAGAIVSTVWAAVKRGARWGAIGIAGGTSYMLGVVGAEETPSETLANMTTVQWLGLVLAVLGTWGVGAAAQRRG